MFRTGDVGRSQAVAGCGGGWPLILTNGAHRELVAFFLINIGFFLAAVLISLHTPPLAANVLISSMNRLILFTAHQCVIKTHFTLFVL